jgi:hypothetical protein
MLDVAKQEPTGRTALFDSIDQALSLFQITQLGDAIYLVTDGEDNKSQVSIRKLKEKLAVHGVRVFVFLVPIDGVMTVEEAEGQSQMGEPCRVHGRVCDSSSLAGDWYERRGMADEGRHSHQKPAPGDVSDSVGHSQRGGLEGTSKGGLGWAEAQ